MAEKILNNSRLEESRKGVGLKYTVIFIPLAFVLPLMNLGAVLVIFTTHFSLDPCKARWKLVKQIWQDQFFHYDVLALLVLAKLV